MPSYKHAVFISYNHKVQWWVEKVFYKALSDHLALHNEIDVFLDEIGLHTGDAILKRIQKELSRSKLLVPVLIPRYFSSKWCVVELSSMLLREEQQGFCNNEKPGGLIWPVDIAEGHYPEVIKGRKHKKWWNHYFTGEAFLTSPEYVSFEKQVRSFAKEIGEALCQTPAIKSDWIDPAWLFKATTLHAPRLGWAVPEEVPERITEDTVKRLFDGMTPKPREKPSGPSLGS
jgi:hypothetical protein